MSHRALLDASVLVINQHVGELEILGGVAGAEVRVDGRLSGTMPLAGPVRASAGAVTLRLTAAGFHPVERQITIVAGSLARETIELQPVSVAETPSPAHAAGAAGRASLRTLGGAGLGLGVALAAGGAVAHGLYLAGASAFNQTNSGCGIADPGGGVLGGSACDGIVSSGRTELALAIGAYVVGGVLGVTGLVLSMVAPASAAPRTAGRISCGPGPGLVGLGCGAVF